MKMVFVSLVALLGGKLTAGQCSTSKECFIKDSNIIEPANVVKPGDQISLKFQAYKELLTPLTITFPNEPKRQCTITSDTWNGGPVDIKIPTRINTGNYISSRYKRDVASQCFCTKRNNNNIFEYTIQISNIDHSFSSKIESDKMYFIEGDFATGEGPQTSWTLTVMRAPSDIYLNGTSGVGNWEGGQVNLQNGNVYTVNCTARGVRPAPTFLWFMQDEILNATSISNGSLTIDVPETTNGFGSGEAFDVWQAATFTAESNDDEKRLLCRVDHPGFNETFSEDDKTAYVTLNIVGPPAPSEEGTLTPQAESELVVGEPATILVPFHANPQPENLTWILADVGALAGNQTLSRYTSRGWRLQNQVRSSSANRSYFAVLDISELDSEDGNYVHTMWVRNQYGSQNYTFRIDIPDDGLSGGAIAGIVIGVLVGVGIIAGGAAVAVKSQKKKKSKKIAQERRQRREEAARANNNEGFEDVDMAERS